MCNVRPCCNDGAEDHQSEGKQGHGRNGASKPQNLTIGNQDNGQVFEDRINRDRKVSESLCAGIDHANQEKGNGKPWDMSAQQLCAVYSCRLSHFFASSVLKSRKVIIPAVLQDWMATTQTIDYAEVSGSGVFGKTSERTWTAKSKKLRL